MAAAVIRPMTGVRGAAALYVMIYHFERHLAPTGPFSIALNHGYLSVDLFFVLSGFVMGHVYGEAFCKGEFRFRDFLLHRVARIYPLYLIITAACIASSLFRSAPSGITVPVILSNLFMVQALADWPSIDPPTWSVSVEAIAYLLFPAIALLCLRSGRTIAFLLGMTALAVILFLSVAAAHHLIGASIARGELDLFFSPYTVIRCLAGFTLGQLVWRMHLHPLAVRYASSNWVQLAVGAWAILTLSRAFSDFLIYLGIIPLLLCLTTERGFLSRLFGSRPLYFAGTLSFAVYLIHFEAIGLFDRVNTTLSVKLVPDFVAGPTAAVLTGSVVVSVSWLLHLTIERPCGRLIREISSVRHRVTPILR